MKFATLPIWQAGATQSVACTPTLGFPIPGSSSDIISGELTLRPLQFTLAKAVEYWWRVKIWRITINFPSGPGTITFDLARNAVYADGPNPINYDERDLLYPECSWLGTKLLPTEPDPDNEISASITLMPLPGRIFQGQTVVDSYQLPPSNNTPGNRLIAPCLVFSFGGIYNDGNGVAAISIPFVVPPFSPDQTDVSGTFDGHPTKVRYSAGALTEPTSFTFAPHEWYTWANADGSDPAWNAATGERI